MKFAALPVFFSLLLSSAVSLAEEGEWLEFVPKDRGAAVAVHTGRINGNTSKLTAWLRWEFREPLEIDGEPYSFETEKREVDCVGKRSRSLSSITQQSREGGRSVASGIGPWNEAPPGSLMARAIDFLCDHPPFTGWRDDPFGVANRVAQTNRRGDTVTRWEEYDEMAYTWQREYDCKRGRMRDLYFAKRKGGPRAPVFEQWYRERSPDWQDADISRWMVAAVCGLGRK